MIPEKLKEIMKKDGVVAIATLGESGPHLVNTWNSYVKVSQDGRLFIPAGYMHKTEANIAHNPNVLITLGSSKVKGLHGPGAGFLIKGAETGELITAVRKVANHKTYVSPSILDKMTERMVLPSNEVPEAVLSNREMQVLVRLAHGDTSREVSKALCLSLSTVETYRSRVLEKLGLRNNSDITRFAIRRGLIDVG